MKTTRIFTPLVLMLLAVSISGNLNAQAVPVPVLEPGHTWHYETNADGTQSIEEVDISTVPGGIGVQTVSVFKHTSFDVSWDQWWWCAAIAFQTDPVDITEETKTLKMKVFSETLTKYYIIAKQADEQTIITIENFPVEPNKWNTVEVDLSSFAGHNIGKFELVPGLPGQTIYFYPYFEDPTPKTKIAEVVSPLVTMDESLLTFSSNNPDATSISIIDTTGLDVPVPVSDKIFKIHTNDIAGWQFWWNIGISLNDAEVVPEDESTVLVAQVKSPNSQFIIMQFADDDTLLNTAYNWGTRDIVPDEWNEIVMDYISPHRGWSFLKRIEMAAYVANIDAYIYFYWAKKDNEAAIKRLKPLQKNVKIAGNQIVVEGVADIKQYTVTGALVNTSSKGSVPALDGLNIIVADGIAYKVLYNRK
ncbi:MAG: hypothetical protein LBP83_02855 [Dysgonamonadaceae bacterium]|jgi:hypothetical protein|nr:hypothetical protein [Dysgonamonadaceae bacterium]